MIQTRDDGNAALTSSLGLRPDFAHACNATTGASITELDISSLNIAANRSALGNEVTLMVVCISNSCYFSLGAASSPPGANTAMMLIPAGVVVFMKAHATDVSAYHQQITGAGTLKIVALV